MNFMNRQWIFAKKTLAILHSPKTKNLNLKFLFTLIAIVTGIFLSFILLWILQANPLAFYRGVFYYPFKNLFVDETWTTFAVYTIAGLAIAFAFKTGLFNIGVSGQMLLSGSMVTVFAIAETKYSDGGAVLGTAISPSLFMIIALFIAVGTGIFAFGIAGFLKTFLNVNEVVTGILLNYTFFYFCKWIFLAHPNYNDSNISGSKPYASSFSFDINGHYYIVPVIIAICCVIFAIIYLKYSKSGYKIKAVQLSPSVASNSGILVKKVRLKSCLLSGAFAGLAGYVYYLSLSRYVTFQSTSLNQIGFNAIAIALLAFNNPIAIIGTSLFWGVFSEGSLISASLPSVNISPNLAPVIFGIVLYFAGIAAFLQEKNFFVWSKKMLVYQYSGKWRNINAKLYLQIKNNKIEITRLKKQVKFAFAKKSLKDQKAYLKDPIKNNLNLVDNKKIKKQIYDLKDKNTILKQEIKNNYYIAYIKSYYYKKLKLTTTFRKNIFEEYFNIINEYNLQKNKLYIVKSNNKLLQLYLKTYFVYKAKYKNKYLFYNTNLITKNYLLQKKLSLLQKLFNKIKFKITQKKLKICLAGIYFQEFKAEIKNVKSNFNTEKARNNIKDFYNQSNKNINELIVNSKEKIKNILNKKEIDYKELLKKEKEGKEI